MEVDIKAIVRIFHVHPWNVAGPALHGYWHVREKVSNFPELTSIRDVKVVPRLRTGFVLRTSKSFAREIVELPVDFSIMQ